MVSLSPLTNILMLVTFLKLRGARPPRARWLAPVVAGAALLNLGWVGGVLWGPEWWVLNVGIGYWTLGRIVWMCRLRSLDARPRMGARETANTGPRIEPGSIRMKTPVSKELVAASSRPMVLSILTGGESYGYEILKQVKLLSGGKLEWSDGMLYPVLHRLERDGLIAGHWQLTEEGRRRKYYRLTKRGKGKLATDRENWRTVHGALEMSWGGSHVWSGS